MSNDSHTVLVTGGAGYIGSHACKLLAANGQNPVVVDNLSTGHEWAVKWGDFENCDIRDEEKLSEIFTRYKPDAVMHFAAHISVGESVEDPQLYYSNNVGGLMTLLNVMRRQNVKALVFSSSCVIYGDPQYMPLDEIHSQNPVNPYGVTKYLAERMIADYYTAYGMGYVCLRYFNAAGADPDSDIGEAHEPETHLIPLVLDAAAGRRDGIAIFGTDYETPDGTCVRDYIHIADLAEAHLLALKHLMAGKESQYFNLGNGNGYSVREVIELCKDVTGLPIKVTEGPRRAGDPLFLVSDSTRAEKILGWKPKRGDLRTQIEDAWRWHQKYFGANG